MTRGLLEALESALDEDPDDLASWMALADHLAEQGDPRGELMRVQLALEAAARSPTDSPGLAGRLLEEEKQILERHQRGWLSEMAKPLLDQKPTPYQVQTERMNTCRWARGGLGELRLTSFGLEEARSLVRCPAARFLRKLEIDHNYAYEAGEAGSETEPGDNVPPDDEWFSALFVLHDAAFLPHLRYLRVGEMVDLEDERYDSGHCSARGLVGVLERTPRLEELHVLARNPDLDSLFALRLPRLKVMTIYHEMDTHPLSVMADNDGMPALESLSVHPAHSDDDSYLPRDEVVALVRSPHFPALRTLRLRASDLGDEGVKVIVESGILKRLKVLDLRHGRVTDEGARTLAACPDVRGLELLDLGENQIGESGLALLGGLGVAVRLKYQHGVGSDDYLFSGDME
jgi:uncharacterized protein (TIGR02996 family)